MMINEEAMTNEEAIKLLSQVMDAILASNSWLPSTDNPIKECFGMAINALKALDAAGDTISRQAAIEIVDRYDKSHMILKGKPMLGAASIVIELEALPSAQPERIDCTECPEYDHDTHSCPKYCDVIRQTLAEAKQERKTGRWIRRPYDGIYCTTCGKGWSFMLGAPGDIENYHYCPNCGAKMEGES